MSEDLRIAVLSLTRDRLHYTQHCFGTLESLAGCDYDHYVLDQGSMDCTDDWLLDRQENPRGWCHYFDATFLPENIGVCPGLNVLMTDACDADQYDVIVRFDNDCEVVYEDTLLVCAQLAIDHNIIVAPKVRGLRNPPPPLAWTSLDGCMIEWTSILGGVFMAIPAAFFWRDGYRWDESNPPWAGDEAITSWHRSRGGRCGYVRDLPVNHYETTDGQHARYPDYFQRRVLEGGPV